MEEEASSVLAETLAISSKDVEAEDHTLTWEEEEEALHPCCLAQMSQDDHPFLKTEKERKG